MLTGIDLICMNLRDAQERYQKGLINEIGFARAIKDAIRGLADELFHMVRSEK